MENISEMTMDQIEERCNMIQSELKEENADLDALASEIEQLEARKAEIKKNAEERKAAVEEVMNSKPVETFEKEEVRKEMEIKELRNTPEYIDAYAEYLKGNDKEIRTLLTENVSGTVAVPELVYDIVKNAWEREGIMARVRKTYLQGKLKVQFEVSSNGATVHTEGGDAVSEESLVLGVVNLPAKSIKKWVGLSDEVYDLRGESFLNYIYDELTYQIAKKAADELIADIIACGTVSTNTSPGVPAVSGALAVGSVAAAMAQLSDQAANPVIMMNRQTWGAFKQAAYAASYGVDPFEGLPVLFNNTITAYNAASTGDTYAIIGDLAEGAIANFPNGEEITIKFDDKTLMTSDIIRVLGRQYVGIGVVAPDHFVKLKK